MGEILQKTKLSIQTDESIIFNQAILLVYVRFFDEDDIREEMLFIKRLPESTILYIIDIYIYIL